MEPDSSYEYTIFLAKERGCQKIRHSQVLLKPDPSIPENISCFHVTYVTQQQRYLSATFYFHDYIRQIKNMSKFQLLRLHCQNIQIQIFRTFKHTLSELKEYCSSVQKLLKTNGTEMCGFTYLLSYVVICE